MEFTENTVIYKKRYIHQHLVTDYSKPYLIDKIKEVKNSYGISYLAILDNKEEYEVCFVEEKTGKTYIYAEKYEMNCICC
tara:strand:+ start:369 stop:608 length:240 start_codon:yes stop_codon:yes gene_type:complete